jgi:hypothetical protein
LSFAISFSDFYETGIPAEISCAIPLHLRRHPRSSLRTLLRIN